MVAFKLLLSLALVSVALARDFQFPRATVDLSGEGLDKEGSNSLQDRIGEPFFLTCTFDPTLPEEDPNSPSMSMPWHAEVTFGILRGSYDMQVFGAYKIVNQCEMKYVTENYFRGVNVYPVTKLEPGMGTMGEMRTNYTVAVLATDSSQAGGEYQCSVKLSQEYSEAGVQFFSNQISIN